MIKQQLGFKTFPAALPLTGDLFSSRLICPVFTTNTANIPAKAPCQLRVLLLYPWLQAVQQQHVTDLVGRLVQQEVALQDAVQLCHLEFHVLQLGLCAPLLLRPSLFVLAQFALVRPELRLFAELVVEVIVRAGELVVHGGQGKPMEANPQPGTMGWHSGSSGPGGGNLVANDARLCLAARAGWLPWVVRGLALPFRAWVDWWAWWGGTGGGGGAGFETTGKWESIRLVVYLCDLENSWHG